MEIGTGLELTLMAAFIEMRVRYHRRSDDRRRQEEHEAGQNRSDP